MVATSASPTTCHILRPHKSLSVTGIGVDVVGSGPSDFTFGDGMKISFSFPEHESTWNVFDKAKFKGFSVYKRIQVERSRMININSLHLKKNTIWSTPHADNTEHTNQRICKLNQVGLQREVKIIWNHHWNTNELMKLRYYKELVFGLKLIVISPVIFFSEYLNDCQLYIYIYSLFSLDFATISILKFNYNFPFLVQLKY